MVRLYQRFLTQFFLPVHVFVGGCMQDASAKKRHDLAICY